MHALVLETLTSKQLRHLMGHISWAGISRRGLLSLFSSVYKFIEANYVSPRPIWGSVAKELCWATTLPSLLHADIWREWSPTIYASDSGVASHDWCGGYGVCRRTLTPEVAAKVGGVSEHWRLDVAEFVDARKSAVEELDAVRESRVHLGGCMGPRRAEWASHVGRVLILVGEMFQLRRPSDAASSTRCLQL